MYVFIKLYLAFPSKAFCLFYININEYLHQKIKKNC